MLPELLWTADLQRQSSGRLSQRGSEQTETYRALTEVAQSVRSALSAISERRGKMGLQTLPSVILREETDHYRKLVDRGSVSHQNCMARIEAS